MFVEFEPDMLEQWNRLSDEEKERKIRDDEVQIAMNVDIQVEMFQKISEEHKYYEVINQMVLVNDIEISGMDNQGATFLIQTYRGGEEADEISVSLNEEKKVAIGMYEPFITYYRIRVYDLKYGVVKEL